MSDFFATPWTAACQAPLSTEFPMQYWNGLPFPTPGDLPDPRIEPASSALADGFFTTKPLEKAMQICKYKTGCLVSSGLKIVLVILSSFFHQGIQFSSVAQLCLTLCDPMDCRMSGFPALHQLLLKLRSTESVMPSYHLILCCPLLLLPSIFLSIRVFSNESVLCIR